MAFKIRQDAFPVGTPPAPRWGSSPRFPDPQASRGGDTPTHSAPRFREKFPQTFFSKTALLHHTVTTKKD